MGVVVGVTLTWMIGRITEMNNQIIEYGTVTISGGKILVSGFINDSCSCRELGISACDWAIKELQREMELLMAAPGGSDKIIVD